ncbi:hypothetical protein A2477_00960 [Candidatus Falkowbacteria bacterium RIFOXYC2_FULL_47_12]|uniref:SprT-like domain-containing protein n=1 Tax=Candidatus Falkowbacteria bacterium RIFOXYC2_FULL_47_12 TaxID=1798004 RepID=A0A1F5TSC6_9BACT|nr:MAG: hypothetical protein A2477_00960 [Candidatus Falkowbacteria bacterium RIFOXYC2_FULL_47_12]
MLVVMSDEVHELMIKNICSYACRLLKYPDLKVKTMQRLRPVGKNRGYVMGHTSIASQTITLDLYTARQRKPKKISAILAVLAHEITHHQKPPYRQWHHGRWIARQHFPKFYTQVNKNMGELKQDELLGKYFT